jgi:putative hemolysin
VHVDTTFFIIALLCLTFLSGYFSASETALFSLSAMKVRAYAVDPDPRRNLIAKLVLQPRDLLVTIFMLNTLVNIMIQNVSSSMFGGKASLGIKIGFPLVVMLLFGEIIPKYYGLQNNISLSYQVAPSITYLQRLLEPIRKWIIHVTLPVSRVLFFFLKKEESISDEELQHVLETSKKQGVLQSEEAELIQGYLSLQDTLVKELMRPREDMVCYDINDPLSKLTYYFSEKHHARIPIYNKTLENLMGIISAKQYFLHQEMIREPQDLQKWMKKPFYIPENTQARSLLRRFDKQHQQIAIVVDEYGSISGLITREDILEVVIGKIAGPDETKATYAMAGENEIIASGKLELSVFNDIMDAHLESPSNMVTIGGWLMEHMGDIPKTGTKYTTNDFFFHVLAADPNRIRRIYIRKIIHPNSQMKKRSSK